MAHTVTMKGNPVTLEGPELKVGDKAPDVTLKSSLVESIKLSDTNGTVRVLSVVPSLDTPVCAMQTKRFNQEVANLPNVQILTISTDLPVAQSRFCAAEGIDTAKIRCLSDHMDGGFGKAFGTLVPNLRIECRALFVLDKEGVIRHVEYTPEITTEPNYEAALDAAKKCVG